MKLAPSSIETRARSLKSSWLMAAMRFTPTKPPGASRLARFSSCRSVSGVLHTPETVPTHAKRALRAAATLPARPSDECKPMAPWTSRCRPDRRMSAIVDALSAGNPTDDMATPLFLDRYCTEGAP